MGTVESMSVPIKNIFRRIGLASKETNTGLKVNDEERLVMQQEFDFEFYILSNPDVAASEMDPLDHYMSHGWREGRDPTPYFSTAFYLSTYSDVRLSRVNPFWHFIVSGRSEGRAGRLDFPRLEEKSGSLEYPAETEVARVLQPHFDENYYLKKYPEVKTAELDALTHFCRQGWKLGNDPSEFFSTSRYLEKNPDVAATGVNPFWHYIVAGRDEGRSGKPNMESRASKVRHFPSTEVDLIVEHFDRAFYLSMYADVAREGVDPLEHYWNNGWKEGRDPCSTFSTAFYIESNPDVANKGINPFWHYVAAGKSEGRLPQHPGGYRVERLRTMDTLEDEVLRWVKPHVSDTLINREDIFKSLVKRVKGGSRTLFLSFGHDNYMTESGGIQVCVHREEQIATLSRDAYLYIYPLQSLPRLARLQDDVDPIVCLVLNGEEVGACRFSDMVHAIKDAVVDFDETQLIIHQLLGHLPERILELVQSANLDACWLWLHDFITICPSYTLQRNSVAYCGAPPPNSNACTLCRFGGERRTHMKRMTNLFTSIDVHVLSPSQVTADLWKDRSGLTAASVSVLPHMTIDWRKRRNQLTPTADIVTIGFLGTPASHKGWNVFEALFRSLGRSDQYRFIFLGASELPAQGIDYRRVRVTSADPDAMIAAVIEEKVDFVLHWASWPETFSLSTYEALAGGAYVITNSVSGNVASTISRFGRGVVLTDEADLQDFFRDGRADEMIGMLRAERRSYEVQYQFSRLTHDAKDLLAVEART